MSSHPGHMQAAVSRSPEERVLKTSGQNIASHLNERASEGINRNAISGGYHSCIFSYCFSFFTSLFARTHGI